jgi:hypothetical protein
MPMLHQHPEGLIFVRTKYGHYGETPKKFPSRSWRSAAAAAGRHHRAHLRARQASCAGARY